VSRVCLGSLSPMGPASGPGCRPGVGDAGWQPRAAAGWRCDPWMGQWRVRVPSGDGTVTAVFCGPRRPVGGREMLADVLSECPLGDLWASVGEDSNRLSGQRMKGGESTRGPTPTQNVPSSVDNCVDQSDLCTCICPGPSEPQSAAGVGGWLPAHPGSSFLLSPSAPWLRLGGQGVSMSGAQRG